MQRLSSLLSTTKAVLEDAEQKQLTDRAIQRWLQKLNVVAYEIEDILDDYAAEASRVEYKNSGCFSLMCYRLAGNLVFRHRIGTRMKEVLEKFKAINDDRINLGLSDQRSGGNHFQVVPTETRETGSLPNEHDRVVGRDKEKEKIVEILVNQVRDNQSVSVLPIVGVGGLGKTTLAQLVFNDERITKHFEVKLWACVFEDFNLKTIIKALIESKEQISKDASDLDPLQRKLQELLRGKRYLVVLDDVWNDDALEWEKLKSVLICGSSGSSIVTTTRMEKVAQIMGTLGTCNLSSLSKDHCWLLFKQWAFDRKENQENSSLEAIGKEIVKKCSGVPLAAKALGSFLRFKTEAEWNSVKCSELWNLNEDENRILPALKLSYLNLPVELRGCFAHCALFPKGSIIDKGAAIHLWMANGLISSKGMMEVEDVGDAVLTALHYRSLIQVVKKDEFGSFLAFTMHDLVHDMAQSVMKGKHDGTESDNTIRNLLLDLSKDQLIVAFPFTTRTGTDQYSSFLSRYGSLRTFLAGPKWIGKIKELSPAISKLKHLRYLCLSGSDIVELPDSICDLWNLQILYLNQCHKLRSLPKGMRFLRNLRHLCLEGCEDLTYMPSGIGKLTCLRTLSVVVLGGEEGFRLDELRELNNLGGNLRIRQLERVKHKKDAEEANLIAKQSLRVLYLEWDSERRSPQFNDEEVLEALKPCPNLQFLCIAGLKGTSFPAWFSTLTNLVEIELRRCHNCMCLPVIGHLPHLQRLDVCGNATECIIDDDVEEPAVHGAALEERATTAAAAAGTRFPSLKRLTLRDMPNLKGMLGREVGLQVQGGTREVFPRLQSLLFYDCPSLTSPSPPRMLSLEELRVSECPNMAWASISNLANLKTLLIQGVCEGLSYFPEEMLQNLSLLESLEITGMRDLQALPGRSLASLTALKKLTIKDCPELKSLPEEGLQGLASLHQLYLIRCNNLVSLSMGTKALKSLTHLYIARSNATALPKELKHVPALQALEIMGFANLTSLPDWFGRDHLTSLQHLTLMYFPKLETLPSTIQMMTTLQSLTIISCELLGPRCEREGLERYKIQHIPQVRIEDWGPSPW